MKMNCFLCSSYIGGSGISVNVSLTNIFKSLQIKGKSETVERFCCIKCTRVTNDMTSLLEKMEKVKLELKVNLGQFGLLINQHDGNTRDDKFLKKLAKQKSLEIFSGGMEPTINLFTLNTGVLENSTENQNQVDSVAYNATEVVLGEMASYYGSAGTVDALENEQEDQAGNLNNDRENIETGPLMTNPFNDLDVIQETTSLTTRTHNLRNRKIDWKKMPSKKEIREGYRQASRNAQQTKGFAFNSIKPPLRTSAPPCNLFSRSLKSCQLKEYRTGNIL